MSRYQAAPRSDDPASGYGKSYANGNGQNTYNTNGNGNGTYGGYSDDPNSGYGDGGYGKAYGTGGAVAVDECELASAINQGCR